MSWTSVGFDGTITEIQWAGMASLLGNDYVAASATDCAVTAVGGARQVSVAAGSLYGDGVVSTNSGAETVALTTPVNGQWYVVALRRTWATNTAELVAIAGATTSTTTPTSAPSSFPTLNTNVGVLTDQPIAWAWCNSANTTVVVFDIRMRAVKSLPPVVATSAERDAKFMTPTQGTAVWRDDLGAVETYYDLYNSSTNPGGRDTAGWYTSNRSGGLIPIQPTSAVIATGSGSANAMGVITFTGATAVSLNGVFSSSYKNYKLVVTTNSVSTATNINIRLRASGTDYTATNYNNMRTTTNSAGATASFASASGAQIALGVASNATNTGSGDFIISNPAHSVRKTVNGIFSGYSGSNYAAFYGGSTVADTGIYDGITYYPSSGNITGTIQVFGIVN